MPDLDQPMTGVIQNQVSHWLITSIPHPITLYNGYYTSPSGINQSAWPINTLLILIGCPTAASKMEQSVK